MHIFKVILPFYPPCEVKSGLQNRVSTHMDTCKTIFNGLIGLLPDQAMFLALQNVLDLTNLLPKEKILNDACIDRMDLKSKTSDQPVAKHVLSNPF